MSDRFPFDRWQSGRPRGTDDTPLSRLAEEERYRGGPQQMRGLGPPGTQRGTTPSRPYHVDDGNFLRLWNEPGFRASHRHPAREESDAYYSDVRATAGSSSTASRQAGTDYTRRSPEPNRAPQDQSHYDEPVVVHSAHAISMSSSPSRRVRDAIFPNPHEYQDPQSESILLPHIGSQTSSEAEIWPEHGPPYPRELSYSISPPHQPLNPHLRESYARVSRREHDDRAVRSEVFELDERTEQYYHARHRPLHDRRDDFIPGHHRHVPLQEQQRLPYAEIQHLHSEERHRTGPPDWQRFVRCAERPRRRAFDSDSDSEEDDSRR